MTRKRNIQTHIWATLLWIDTNVQLAKTNYVLGSLTGSIYLRKLKAYKKHVLLIERETEMFPNTYKYLLMVKSSINVLIREEK